MIGSPLTTQPDHDLCFFNADDSITSHVLEGPGQRARKDKSPITEDLTILHISFRYGSTESLVAE
jgi:hypothetical protein